MLNLRNEKLNTALNQVAANVSNLIGREVRRSNKNGMILAVDVVDFEDHIINLWFTNAESAVEKRASDFQVWDTFMHILRAKEKLDAKSIRTEQGNYVQFTTQEEIPSVSFEFNADSLNFTPSGLAPKAFISDLRAFANTMSRRPYNEQAWFEKNFPTASNFGEALLMMLRKHNKTVNELFADNTDEVVELSKLITSKLIQHKIYKEDLIQGNTTPFEHVVTDETQEETKSSDVKVKDSTYFGEQLSAALQGQAEEREESAEKVCTQEPTEQEVKAEVDASTENSEEAESKLRSIFADLSKYHAAPNQGKQRKQMIRSLSKAASITENSEMLITLLEVVELSKTQREEYRNEINASVSLSVAVSEDDVDLSELEDIADEFESETFETDLGDTEKFEESESNEDTFEFEDDADSIEDEDDDAVTFSDEDEDEDEEDEDVESEESESDSESNKDKHLQELITLGKGRLRQRARKLGMPLAKSCSSDVYALAKYIYNSES